MPQLEIVNKYLSSDKFKKARDWYSYDYSKYLPYVTEHKDNPKFMFCQLTKAEIPKIPSKVEIHVGSKRYKRKLAEVEEKNAKRKEKGENSSSFWVPKEELEEEGDDDGLNVGEDGSNDSEGDAMDENEEGEEEDDDEFSDEEFIVRAVPRSVSEPQRKRKKAMETSSSEAVTDRGTKKGRKEKKGDEERKEREEKKTKQSKGAVSKKREQTDKKSSGKSLMKPNTKKVKK